MADADRAFDPRAIAAITLDFGNTLVPFSGPLFDGVLRLTAERSVPPAAAAEFMRIWDEERLRQFAEEVPEGREAGLDVRAVRILARLRGCPEPGREARWDDLAAAGYSEPDEVQAILEAYSDAFVALTPVPAEVGPLLGRLAVRYRLAIVSNWPLTLALERFVEAAGWRRHLAAVVVSHRIGAIKPRPAIFRAAAEALGVRSGPELLHVGDDLAADVAGAQALGWRAAWIRSRPADSPLPTAPPVEGVVPDLCLESLTELEAALAG